MGQIMEKEVDLCFFGIETNLQQVEPTKTGLFLGMFQIKCLSEIKNIRNRFQLWNSGRQHHVKQIQKNVGILSHDLIGTGGQIGKTLKTPVLCVDTTACLLFFPFPSILP
eukprot:TRINITY_DN4116_c1_g3_i1.p1 TRINITY_DN4116_c1_g3~~TRINITY_DN4116_c1_g3_i1.p1  ORF type:complete len:110 (+),score=16.08 TRINITY_DN4116_c1_g3_i1:300-629(+)